MAKPRKTVPVLKSERIVLRPFRAGDTSTMHKIYADAKHMKYWSVDPSSSLAATRKAMRWHVAYHPFHYAMWAVEEIESGKLIGMINYHRRDLRERRVDMGWVVLPGRSGKGYMTEAARTLLRYLIDTLKIHKVEALIRRENKPSAALARRLGFRLEGGPIRDRWLVSGKWHSVMLYGLIAGEER
jgi:ribosomal-protein-alanine N-acetyltransferase